MAEEILSVIYTDKANADSLTIKNFILFKFTQREVDNFYKMLATFERIVSAFPEIYPLSTENQEIHRAVLSKQLSVFYSLSKDQINVIAVLDNRVGYSKWP